MQCHFVLPVLAPLYDQEELAIEEELRQNVKAVTKGRSQAARSSQRPSDTRAGRRCPAARKWAPEKAAPPPPPPREGREGKNGAGRRGQARRGGTETACCGRPAKQTRCSGSAGDPCPPLCSQPPSPRSSEQALRHSGPSVKGGGCGESSRGPSRKERPPGPAGGRTPPAASGLGQRNIGRHRRPNATRRRGEALEGLLGKALIALCCQSAYVNAGFNVVLLLLFLCCVAAGNGAWHGGARPARCGAPQGPSHARLRYAPTLSCRLTHVILCCHSVVPSLGAVHFWKRNAVCHLYRRNYKHHLPIHLLSSDSVLN
ncbi:uncharacterized protein LOC135186733 [Pogoniulus pusillus]|uniref:uncharacterized protein LOC135186733 n=1 Tax=Pogoniulus pusillus TaxID=488313 RepID=UPI0030B93153